ncbi:hypothetical protein GGI35DRAFT_383055 [Trichoderma velutinum]
MARHRQDPSPARSTVYHQDQCSHSAILPSTSQSKCTCSRTDFIPSWLQHVQTSGMYNDTSRETPRQASPGPGETSWYPNGIPTVHIQSNYDAGRYQASDVFIQDTPSPSSLAGQTARHHVHEPYLSNDYDKGLHGGKGHYHPKPHVSTPSGGSFAEHGIFEKQPRRKTRKDRYNAVKLKDARTGKQQTKKSSTRVSKNGRLRSSREIMANFKSSAITNPDERITLKPSFIPGLFVNGRSSVPQTDLVFNDIPSPDQGHTPANCEQWPKPTAGKSERGGSHRHEVEMLSTASRYSREDSPPSESPDTRDSRATSTTSSSYFQSIQRPSTPNTINVDVGTGRANTMVRHKYNSRSGVKDHAGNNNRPSPQPNRFTLHIRPIYSLSPTTDPYFSDLNMLNKVLSSDDNTMQEAQRESAVKHQGLDTEEIGDERNLGDSDQVKASKYRDIGVMVSPQMQQRTGEHKSSDDGDGDCRLLADERDCSSSRTEPRPPNTFPQMLPHKGNQQDQLFQFSDPEICIASVESQINGYPTYLPRVAERLNLRAEVGDTHHHRNSYGLHSTKHPFHLCNKNGLSSIDDFESLKALNTESGDACNIGLPAQLTSSNRVFQLSRQTHQDANTLCSDALHVIDDIPGESLMEFIERKEHEILRPDEPPISYVDNSLPSAQDACQSQILGVPHTNVFIEARCSNDRLCGIESMAHLSPRKLVRQPVHEERYSPFHQYQRLPSPGEILNREIESELASFWQSNQMMWC